DRPGRDPRSQPRRGGSLRRSQREYSCLPPVDSWGLAAHTIPGGPSRRAGDRLGEPVDEVERRLGGLAPAVVDREGVALAPRKLAQPQPDKGRHSGHTRPASQARAHTKSQARLQRPDEAEERPRWDLHTIRALVADEGNDMRHLDGVAWG